MEEILRKKQEINFEDKGIIFKFIKNYIIFFSIKFKLEYGF